MSYATETTSVKSYLNVMELLVEAEVRRQLILLPPKTLDLLQSSEVTAHALNQLPALYATTKRGWEFQLKAGQQTYGALITQAVCEAINSVIQDPIIRSIPLEVEIPSSLRSVLYQLRVMLKDSCLDWESVPRAVERLKNENLRSVPLNSHPKHLNWLEPNNYRLGYSFGNRKKGETMMR